MVQLVSEKYRNIEGITCSRFDNYRSFDDFQVNFIDVREEDFHYEDNGKHYIGEIKGVTSNVQSKHISQLEVHYQSFIDRDHLEENTFALLVINHQRNFPLNERKEVHEKQINLAKRNGSLIIDTHNLLKMFEKYKSGELSRENCLSLITNKDIGILKIN